MSALDPDPDPLLGQVVADRYRIEAVLGRGGIGKVYLATQVKLNRKAAVKVLHGHLAQRPDVMERFEREARAASRLNHPGSVTVYDFGEHDGQLYIAMEHIPGQSLADILRRDFPLATERVIAIAIQLCNVLEAAHKANLLHRDLKPENILVVKTADGRELVKVVDFGLAFVVGEQREARLTHEDSVAGTPCFMSPEQILNRPLDGRSDVYALGCVMYEMLTRQPPFDATTSMETFTMHLYDEPDPPSRRTWQAIPRELEQVVLWTLQKAPDNRPRDCGELRAALQRALAAHARAAAAGPGIDTTPLRDRQARADEAHIPVAANAPLPVDSGDGAATAVALVEPEATAFADSATAVLRASGLTVAVVASVAAAPDEAEAVVVDVTGSGLAGVLALGPWVATQTRPVLVIGPDEALDAMTKALELGLADYIPASQRATLPRKLRRALDRARKSRR